MALVFEFIEELLRGSQLFPGGIQRLPVAELAGFQGQGLLGLFNLDIELLQLIELPRDFHCGLRCLFYNESHIISNNLYFSKLMVSMLETPHGQMINSLYENLEVYQRFQHRIRYY